jgi:hypothetical protein
MAHTLDSPFPTGKPIDTSAQGPQLLSSPQVISTGQGTSARYESMSEVEYWPLQGQDLWSLQGMTGKLVDVCEDVAKKSAKFSRFAARRLKEFKEERPLQLVGVIAGCAFSLGMLVRVWKER